MLVVIACGVDHQAESKAAACKVWQFSSRSSKWLESSGCGIVCTRVRCALNLVEPRGTPQRVMSQPSSLLWGVM